MIKKIAYFTMEIAAANVTKDINEDFKTYSGGLGVLAGDFYKQATDENLPITFISILWKRGYSKQKIVNCKVIDMENSNDNWRDYVTDTGKTTEVKLDNFNLKLKIWKFNSGELYLLDADLPENGDYYRYLTYNLYGGHEKFKGAEEKERILQEIILGIGGLNALETLNQNIDLYHFNDGHAVFASHKIITDFMNKGNSFEDALKLAKTVIRFTTHTNVPSGNEKHQINTIIQYGANYGLNFSQLERLGGNPYGMTVAALHTVGKANAVAKIHAVQAVKLWENLNDIPKIFPITNGVHQSTWQNEDIHKAYINKNLKDILNIHIKYKEELICYIKESTGIELDVNSLLVGFARRATDYKRWDLFAKNLQALDFMIKTFNVQFVFSGKCHPKDMTGRGYIEKICELAKKYPQNIIFLEGYDMNLAKKLEGGADIWLNTPNGLEASGTSGMKAALNGCFNVSTPDGWWEEACNNRVNGFVIYLHSAKEVPNSAERDMRDCASFLYYMFEEIIPMYQKDKESWSKIMYESIKTAEEYFTTERMMKEYYEKLYI